MARPTNPWHKHPAVRKGDELTAGERAADSVRNRMGSWGFVAGFLIFMALWMVANSLLHLGKGEGFDPYPYILLNLMLSMVAGLQGAILLIAAKRADQVAAEVSQHTLENTETLRALLQRNTDLTEAIESLTRQVHEAICVADTGQPESPAAD